MDSLVSLLKSVIKLGVGLAVLAGLGVVALLGYETWEKQLEVKVALKCELLENGIPDYAAQMNTYQLLVGKRKSAIASHWYQPVRSKEVTDLVGRGGPGVYTLEIAGVVYLRYGSLVVNDQGQYAFRTHWPGKSEDADYTRWIDRADLSYLAYGKKKDGKRDPNQRVTRQCEIVSTKQIASELADQLMEIPEYKI